MSQSDRTDRLLNRVAIIAALLIAFAVVLFILAMPREEKPEYPKHTPTVLPTIPAWTPDPGEYGKG